jgi:hypothetical protein
MEPGEKPDTGLIDGLTPEENLRFLEGQVRACVHPGGHVEVAPLKGVLALAKRDGLDPAKVYAVAHENLPTYKQAHLPPYESVKPQ